MSKRTLKSEESPTDYKASKDCVTVLGCSNAIGTHRCKLLVIGQSSCPRAFKGMTHFPVIYHGNKIGWITTEITLDWFQNYFVPEARAYCDSIGLSLLNKINSWKPVREFLREYNVIDMVYCVANAWKSVEASILKKWMGQIVARLNV